MAHRGFPRAGAAEDVPRCSPTRTSNKKLSASHRMWCDVSLTRIVALRKEQSHLSLASSAAKMRTSGRRRIQVHRGEWRPAASSAKTAAMSPHARVASAKPVGGHSMCERVEGLVQVLKKRTVQGVASHDLQRKLCSRAALRPAPPALSLPIPRENTIDKSRERPHQAVMQ